ncbi:MAG: hypothetical protein H8E79_09475 [Desulfobulbaceae bacterium]|uniref:Uncharacterized protein n=1 Tax=Candidatus Desulfatifera sulfidica TaxID=2841691 RepID=A0A8J6TEL4_9BACT|nr:hypothetical protein [Candidatus Desulfatifera sulfidica]
MRCRKCGYISFDHLDVCRRCNKAIPEELQAEGATIAAAAPSFLGGAAVSGVADKAPESIDAVSADEPVEVVSDFEIETSPEELEDDLEIVFDDLDSSDPVGSVEHIDSPSELSEAPEDDEVDGELELPFDLLSEDMLNRDDAYVESTIEEEPEKEEEISLELPSELADISDLAPRLQEDEPVTSDEDNNSSEFDELTDFVGQDDDLTLDSSGFTELHVDDYDSDLASHDLEHIESNSDSDLELDDLTLEKDN